jgi:hypothetical protein
MKNYLKLISAFILVIAKACNNKSGDSKETNLRKTDTEQNKTVTNAPVTEVNHRFNDIDPNVSVSLKTVIDHYLHIKNALVSDNGAEAANGGKAMATSLSKIDKSFFTADQKKVYDDLEDDLKEHAEHISSNGNNIEHQREHFSMMSEDIYEFVKAFGGGRTLYHDHCPMANDNKGGMWLSEFKEIKNPYYGGKMAECVQVPEVIN